MLKQVKWTPTGIHNSVVSVMLYMLMGVACLIYSPEAKDEVQQMTLQVSGGIP